MTNEPDPSDLKMTATPTGDRAGPRVTVVPPRSAYQADPPEMLLMLVALIALLGLLATAAYGLYSYASAGIGIDALVRRCTAPLGLLTLATVIISIRRHVQHARRDGFVARCPDWARDQLAVAFDAPGERYYCYPTHERVCAVLDASGEADSRGRAIFFATRGKPPELPAGTSVPFEPIVFSQAEMLALQPNGPLLFPVLLTFAGGLFARVTDVGAALAVAGTIIGAVSAFHALLLRPRIRIAPGTLQFVPSRFSLAPRTIRSYSIASGAVAVFFGERLLIFDRDHEDRVDFSRSKRARAALDQIARALLSTAPTRPARNHESPT